MKARTEGIVLGLQPEKIRIDQHTYQLCRTLHTHGPVYGCPVCFLTMLYVNRLVSFARPFLGAVLDLTKDQPLEFTAPTREALAEYDNLEAKVLSHVHHTMAGG